MNKFVILSQREKVKLFNSAKEKTGFSFNKLYPLLRISRTSFFNYYSRGWAIPLKVFNNLENLAKMKMTNYKIIIKSLFLRNNIKIPKLNKSLAEIIGTLNGDGHISKYNYEINIVSDVKEEDYHNYLRNLFKKNFGIMPSSFILKGNTIKLRAYSIDIFNALTKKYDLPIGKKKGKLRVPKLIKNSKGFIIGYLKGLFDTDGTIYVRRKKDMVIEISNIDKIFLKEVANLLGDLGFSVSVNKTHISIYQKNQIHKFFKVIKPANPKHLKKYEIYSKL